MGLLKFTVYSAVRMSSVTSATLATKDELSIPRTFIIFPPPVSFCSQILFPGLFNGDLCHMFRKDLLNQLGPFDERNAVSVETVFVSDLVHFADITDTVYVKMIKRQSSCIILLDNGKCRAVYRLIDPQSLCKSLGEDSLSTPRSPFKQITCPGLASCPIFFPKPLFPPDPKYQLPSFTPFIVRAILFLSISTLKIFTSTTSPTLTASNGCLI